MLKKYSAVKGRACLVREEWGACLWDAPPFIPVSVSLGMFRGRVAEVGRLGNLKTLLAPPRRGGGQGLPGWEEDWIPLAPTDPRGQAARLPGSQGRTLRVGVQSCPGFSPSVSGPEAQPVSVLILLACPPTTAFVLLSPRCPHCSRDVALHWAPGAARPAGLQGSGVRHLLCPHGGSFSGNVVPASLFLSARDMAPGHRDTPLRGS